jgi:hypothetical protein
VKRPSSGIARDPTALGQGDRQYRNSTLSKTPKNTDSGSGTTNMYITITINQSPMDSPDFLSTQFRGKHLFVILI